jgi:ketosteroid isomerase-like protein
VNGKIATTEVTMSEQQHMQVVRQAYDAFLRGDIAAVLDLLSDDVDWEAVNGAGSRIPVGGRRFGRHNVAGFFTTLGETTVFRQFQPKEFIAQGDKVVTLGHYEAEVKPTGRRYESDWAMVFTLRNGKIVHFREYTDSAAIVAAFGMPAAV